MFNLFFNCNAKVSINFEKNEGNTFFNQRLTFVQIYINGCDGDYTLEFHPYLLILILQRYNNFLNYASKLTLLT